MEGYLQRFTNAYEVLARYYDELMDEVDYESWCDYVLNLVESAGVFGRSDTTLGSILTSEGESSASAVALDQLGGQRVLDLACGTGEFSYRLQQRGLKVTAVDISSEMLAIAETKARDRGLRIQFVQQDMRYLELPEAYDLVLCLCDSLNYLLKPEDLKATFNGVVKALKPGGQFVFDINTEHKLSSVYGNHTYAADLESVAFIWENEYQPDTGLCYMDLAFFVPVLVSERQETDSKAGLFEKLTETHVQRAFPSDLIDELLRTAGLELLGQYADLTLASPEPTTERITFHCRKPFPC